MPFMPKTEKYAFYAKNDQNMLKAYKPSSGNETKTIYIYTADSSANASVFLGQQHPSTQFTLSHLTVG